MTPDNPLLKAVIAQPDDDTLRLAVADWFAENDDEPRAEFVRVQVELARGVADRGRRNQLEVRQRDLLLAHEAEWVKPLAKVLECRRGQWGGWVFRRGFVEYFHLPAAVINRRGAELARLTPVRELFLRPATPAQVIALVKKPWLTNLTALYLPATHLTEPALAALLEWPHALKLRVLHHNGLSGDSDSVASFQQKFRHALPSGS
jgi:uncharacterized protein (TIGR02996 family)